jgi:hypothetical protein
VVLLASVEGLDSAARCVQSPALVPVPVSVPGQGRHQHEATVLVGVRLSAEQWPQQWVHQQAVVVVLLKRCLSLLCGVLLARLHQLMVLRTVVVVVLLHQLMVLRTGVGGVHSYWPRQVQTLPDSLPVSQADGSHRHLHHRRHLHRCSWL